MLCFATSIEMSTASSGEASGECDWNIMPIFPRLCLSTIWWDGHVRGLWRGYSQGKRWWCAMREREWIHVAGLSDLDAPSRLVCAARVGQDYAEGQAKAKKRPRGCV